MPSEILCIGEPLYEFNQRDRGEYHPGFGGDTANCAVAAARQGATVSYLTRLGDDTFGDAFMTLWEREGIDTQAVIRDPETPTGLYFISHGPEGHRFDYRRAGSAASRMTPEDFPAQVIHSARILHASAISQAISVSAADTVFWAMAEARDHGVRVSFDTNLRRQLWPLPRAKAIINAALGQCDIALPSVEDAHAFSGLEDPDRIADYCLTKGATIVALTLGTDGVLVATSERRERIPGRQVDAVDATGAGDTFDGCFLAELLLSGDPFQAARYANTAASLAVQGYGAVGPMPRRGDVEKLIG